MIKIIYSRGVWVQILGRQGARTRVILVLRECFWNAAAVSLVLPTFNDTGSLGSPRQVVYSPGTPLDDCFPFPCGE